MRYLSAPDKIGLSAPVYEDRTRAYDLTRSYKPRRHLLTPSRPWQHVAALGPRHAKLLRALDEPELKGKRESASTTPAHEEVRKSVTPQLSRLTTTSSVAPVSAVNKFEVLSIEDYANQDFIDWRQVLPCFRPSVLVLLCVHAHGLSALLFLEALNMRFSAHRSRRGSGWSEQHSGSRRAPRTTTMRPK